MRNEEDLIQRACKAICIRPLRFDPHPRRLPMPIFNIHMGIYEVGRIGPNLMPIFQPRKREKALWRGLALLSQGILGKILASEGEFWKRKEGEALHPFVLRILVAAFQPRREENRNIAINRVVCVPRPVTPKIKHPSWHDKKPLHSPHRPSLANSSQLFLKP
ncbi:hypothetical protein VNO77_02964 [Canavalia gladiata]|uniref:Uncharacterized protein n=1 Tax=Canavalia gladiata TaxID=3824 RepID=A0AAN9MTX6_CANGL